ncbi:hypothetical protein, partial [Bathymodiolus platifrons methanotrophic gill symbiont]|uniref:hypothetical protein n=1 Tax=Bathymodiolus platifrons methanotrophic gill symbiont TaxID=113268 RepID=UPI001B7D8A4B
MAVIGTSACTARELYFIQEKIKRIKICQYQMVHTNITKKKWSVKENFQDRETALYQSKRRFFPPRQATPLT